MKLITRAATALAVAGSLALAALPARAQDTIVDTAVKAGTFTTLVAAVKAAGLEETLKGKGPFTVLAPTDAAFKALPAGTLETLLKPESKATLAAILKYHVLPGTYSAERLTKAKAKEYTVKTAEGSSVTFDIRTGVKVDGAAVSKADIKASNGIIHVIDKVILPAKVAKALAAPKPAAPAKAEAPKADAAKAPAAKAEAPKAEAPKAEAPKASAAPAAPAAQPAAPAPAAKK